MNILQQNTNVLDNFEKAAVTASAESNIRRTLELEEKLTNTSSGNAGVGALARHCYKSLKLFRSAKHPPVKAAFYPGVRETIIIAAIGWLLFDAGPSVKRTTGKSIRIQAREMLSLWFRQTIDPPSYYALELYRSRNMKNAGCYLTRYETKNGLLKTLNLARQSPWDKNEMGDKSFFSVCCQKFELPQAQIVGEIANGSATWTVQPELMNFDLFCKRQRGMGAKGCLTFRFIEENKFQTQSGEIITLSELVTHVSAESKNRPMLVQRWLKNHDGLSDLAKDSLLTIRVITCLNEQNQPEVCLAMLRVLAVLEPDWQHLPDGEYAAPIELVSGRLGRLTGDSMNTSTLRYDNHPANNAIVTGRTVPDWPSIVALATRAQGAFNHRLMIGWDIALTPDGPVLLEGNTNFDVMFLQRVHDAPASNSRFGTILEHHLENLVEHHVDRAKA